MTAPPILPLSASSTFPRTGNHSKKIEDFRPGYPRFTSLVSSHNPFFLFRRFSRLRARLLLIKQDKISVLEKKLDEIDEFEKAPIFLGKCRMDRNLDRLTVLSDIETGLAEFDDLVERTGRTLSFGPAEPRDTQSLRNWLDGNRCIARDEAAYLLYERDLFSLSPIVDNAATRLENWIEDRLAQLSSKFQFVS
ncbi:hypothetical protein KAF25_006030 [Fusarium avenaceum]|uniref:DUF6594 domain-containing protein n=1 Tax=Fusarium avenaceum TaxID=40199 RepID=A0A9P7KSI6_9HYPO|nr:hypothetical protein KAF25_006030 [Fusarium avenaceum]